VPTSVQSVTVEQQNTVGNYDEYAYVQTATANIPLTAYITAGAHESSQVPGHSDQVLHVHLKVN
jgi:hypothetical protein